jgi:group I intron endonuclease
VVQLLTIPTVHFDKAFFYVGNKIVQLYVIYKHTSPSGKSYIGQTKHYDKRSMEHRTTKGCRYFAKAIKKYGWNNFTHDILATGLTIKAANHFEQFYIKHFNSLSPNGYNLNTGGKNFVVSEQTRLNMCNAQKGRVITEEMKIRISKTLTGRKIPRDIVEKTAAKLRGRKRTKELVELLKSFHIGKKRSPETCRKISEASKLRDPSTRKKTEEQRLAQSERQKGRKSTEETKQRISENHKGMSGLKHKQETKDKMSHAAKGRKKSEEECKKQSERLKGKPFPLFSKEVFIKRNVKCATTFARKKGVQFSELPEDYFLK